MSNVFLDPIPYNTVFTSEKDVEVGFTSGAAGNFVRIAKATALSFIRRNSAGHQRFAGVILPKTFSGNVAVAGGIAGLYLDESLFRLVVGSNGGIQNLDDLIKVLPAITEEIGVGDAYQLHDLVIRFTIDKNKLRGYKTHFDIHNVVFDGYGFNLPSQGRITQTTRFIASRVDSSFST